MLQNSQTVLGCLALLAFGIALFCTPVLARFLTLKHLTDQPDGNRKMHTRAVPRLGGVAVFVAFLIAAFIGLQAAPVFIPGLHVALLFRMAPALVIIFLVGLADDLFSVSARHKLIFQIVAAVTAVAMGVRFGSNVAASTETIALQSLLTIMWLVLCTNAFNLIDGMDGLAAGLGFILASTMALAGGFGNQPEIFFIALLFAATLLGFLRHNFSPASIFLGDSGSLIIGFLLSCVSVEWSNQQTTVTGKLAPLIAFGVPLADVFLSVARRFLGGRPIFSPDRDHIHHRLLQSGLSVHHSALVLYGVAVFSSAVAMVCVLSSPAQSVAALAIFAVVALLCFRRLNYVEFRALSMAARSLSLNRAMRSQITFSNFENALKAAGDRSRFWLALKQACFEFGFDHIRLNWADLVYEESILVAPTEDRTLLVFSLGGQDSLALSGRFSPEQHRATFGASAFGAFLQTVLSELQRLDIHVQTARTAADVPASRSASVGAR